MSSVFAILALGFFLGVRHATDPDHVVITSGTMDAITLSLQTLCQPGDTVLVESPTYFGLLQAIEHLRLKVV